MDLQSNGWFPSQSQLNLWYLQDEVYIAPKQNLFATLETSLIFKWNFSPVYQLSLNVVWEGNITSICGF